MELTLVICDAFHCIHARPNETIDEFKQCIALITQSSNDENKMNAYWSWRKFSEITLICCSDTRPAEGADAGRGAEADAPPDELKWCSTLLPGAAKRILLVGAALAVWPCSCWRILMEDQNIRRTGALMFSLVGPSRPQECQWLIPP